SARSAFWYFFFQAEDGIRDLIVTGVQTCALPISCSSPRGSRSATRRAGPRRPSGGCRSTGSAGCRPSPTGRPRPGRRRRPRGARSEEHTSELQSRSDLVCRLLLEKNKQILLISSP